MVDSSLLTNYFIKVHSRIRAYLRGYENENNMREVGEAMNKEVIEIKTYDIHRLIWGNIIRFQFLNNLTDEQLAESMEISTRTLYNYHHDPSAISLGKIQKFIKNTGLTIEELTNL